MAWEFEDAVIACVVEGWSRRTSEYISRTALQKLMYFLKASGVPLAINHRMHYCRPYSYEVTDRIEWLEICDAIEDISPNSRSQYRPSSNAYGPITEYRQGLDTYMTTIDNVIGEFAGRSPKEMELLASVSLVHGTAMREAATNRVQ